VVFDTAGGAMSEPSLRSLGRGGRQVAIASTGDRRVRFDMVDFYHNRAHLMGVDSQQFTPSEAGEIARALVEGF
jgi:NADPH:quinone reductase-like Zn-dependent oxidoreductase